MSVRLTVMSDVFPEAPMVTDEALVAVKFPKVEAASKLESTYGVRENGPVETVKEPESLVNLSVSRLMLPDVAKLFVPAKYEPVFGEVVVLSSR